MNGKDLTIMAPQADSSLRARKILSISNTPGFFRLPREVRDDIYSRVLIEPIFWNKRHRKQCPFYDPNADSEITPAMMVHVPERMRLPCGWDTHKQQQCTAICVRRKSLGLLRVNKQIHDEASKVFWSGNTLCFHDWDPLEKLLIPDFRMNWTRVQRISIWLYGPSPSRNALRDLFHALAELNNLEHLEMSPEYLPPRLDYLFKLPKLKTVRLVALGRVYMTLPNTWWTEEICLWAAIHRYYVLPDHVQTTSSNEVACPSGGARSARTWCQECHSLFDKMLAQVVAWAEAWTDQPLQPPMECFERVSSALSHKRHQNSANPEHTITVALSDGSREAVTVWGLPVDPIEVRNKRRNVELRPRQSPSRRPLQRVVPLDHEEDGSVLLGSRKLQSRHPPVQETEYKESVLQERRERKENEAKAEAKAQKKKQRKETLSRQRSEQLMKAEKKEARRRSANFVDQSTG